MRSPQKTSRIDKSSILNVTESDVSSVTSNSKPIVEDEFPYDTSKLQREVDTEILIEKEQTIQELRETVDVRTFSHFFSCVLIIDQYTFIHADTRSKDHQIRAASTFEGQ